MYHQVLFDLFHETLSVLFMPAVAMVTRAPEVMFQPTMVGVDQCGLVDALELILHSYPSDVQQRLVNVRERMLQ